MTSINKEKALSGVLNELERWAKLLEGNTFSGYKVKANIKIDKPQRFVVNIELLEQKVDWDSDID